MLTYNNFYGGWIKTTTIHLGLIRLKFHSTIHGEKRKVLFIERYNPLKRKSEPWLVWKEICRFYFHKKRIKKIKECNKNDL